MFCTNKIINVSFFATVLFLSGCAGSHAIHCVKVGSNEICFKREVWGFNGDKVWITEDKNVCRKPSPNTDYVTDGLINGSSFLYKTDGDRLYVYPYDFTPSKNRFPVEIVSEHYDPSRDISKENYQKVELGSDKMTSCLSDLF